MKEDILIGIDPGTNTGVAVWDSKNQRFIEIVSCGIVTALNKVSYYTFHSIRLFIEDPNTWKPFGTVSNAKLQGAGSIKRDFAIWKEFCENLAIPMTPVKLQGTSKKLKSDYFQQLTGWTKPTNEHGRDAAMLVFKRK